MMKLKIKWLKSTVMILALGILITGCASSPKTKAVDREKYLISSGFKKILADTDEKLDHLKKMPQHEIFNLEKEGTLYYVWADQKSCNCIYYGDEDAYETYQQILLTLKLRKDDAASAALERAGPRGNWGMWGSWRGPFRY
jgi:hypothetical protein